MANSPKLAKVVRWTDTAAIACNAPAPTAAGSYHRRRLGPEKSGPTVRDTTPMTDSVTRRDAFASAAALAVGVAAVAAAPGEALADQPNMRKALAALEDARGFLQNAATNKGGHRAKALDLTSQAIGEVRAGIRFAEG